MKIKKGFTLIELIIVIAILGILAAILIPKVLGVKSNAQEGVNRANVNMIKNAVSHYRAQNDEYPQVSTVSDFEKELTNNGKGTYEIATLPRYKDGSSMIKSYSCTAAGKDNYEIILKDDPGTPYNEDGVKFTEGTNANKLFK